MVRRRAGEPGADGAPDRSPAQEHLDANGGSRALHGRPRGAHPEPRIETGLYRQVLALWQTAMCRLVHARRRRDRERLAYYRTRFRRGAEVLSGARRKPREVDLEHDVGCAFSAGHGSAANATASFVTARRSPTDDGGVGSRSRNLEEIMARRGAFTLLAPRHALARAQALAAAAGDTNPNRQRRAVRQG